MARKQAVWGIDIGQCALKALRLRDHDEPNLVVADAFDFIEYPKILSQPEANPEELIKEALAQFLSRNSVRGDRVAISVAGQAGLARFIKLPPVESKKIPDIVKYEARQQIPFALEDVVWDYQQMAGGNEEDGFALETEVGLFAMKREQVAKVLAPYNAAGIEIDYVQMAPLALYNFVAFDQLEGLDQPYDPDNPPESLVVLSLGTDNTDLVVTNGYRVWQRSIALGGSHFTKALTKELKLTFAKAEHLKRNAAQAEDPRAVFQAMRPVFGDMVTEIQRSINYFKNIDRTAKITRILGLGNAMKLPGLQRFLTQQLGLEVVRPESFRGLTGDSVVGAPAFKENLLSFATCYGLALQDLRPTQIRTNLIPPEIVQERLIRSKKPWAVAAAALLLVGLSVTTIRDWQAWRTAHQDGFAAAASAADGVRNESARFQGDYTTETSQIEQTAGVGFNLVKDLEQRELWLEILASINACIPNEALPTGEAAKASLAERIGKRQRIYLRRLDCVRQDDLGTWAANTAEFRGEGIPDPNAPAAPGPDLTGEGFVFVIDGYHYHNLDPNNEGAEYIRRTLMHNLGQWKLTLPGATDDPSDDQTFEVGRAGLGLPTLLSSTNADEELTDPEVVVTDPMRGAASSEGKFKLRRTDFVVEFAWKPTPPSQRFDPPPQENLEGQAPPGGLSLLFSGRRSRRSLGNG